MTSLASYWMWEHAGRDQARLDWDGAGTQYPRYDEGLTELTLPVGYWEGHDSELSILAVTDPGPGDFHGGEAPL